MKKNEPVKNFEGINLEENLENLSKEEILSIKQSMLTSLSSDISSYNVVDSLPNYIKDSPVNYIEQNLPNSDASIESYSRIKFLPVHSGQLIESLPGLTQFHSEETARSEEILKIIEINSLIHSQVKLKLQVLREKSQNVFKKDLTTSLPQISEIFIDNTIKINPLTTSEYFKKLKEQQEYLIQLLDQISLLQSEIEISLKLNQDETITKTMTPVPNCTLEGFYNSNKTVCKCLLF